MPIHTYFIRPDSVLSKTPYHLVVCSMEDDPLWTKANDDHNYPHISFVSVNGDYHLNDLTDGLKDKYGIGRSPLLVFADLYPNMIAASRLTVEAELNGFGAVVLSGGLDHHDQFYKIRPIKAVPERGWKEGELLNDFLVDATGLKQILAKGDHLIIDTRRPDEFDDDGHLNGANNLPYSEITCDVLNYPGRIIDMINERLDEDQTLNDNRPIMTTCVDGINANVLGLAMKQLGYSVVVNDVHIDQTLAIENGLTIKRKNNVQQQRKKTRRPHL